MASKESGGATAGQNPSPSADFIKTADLFEAAQRIRTARANSADEERSIPRKNEGRSLLSGNVYRGRCGSRLSLTTNVKTSRADDPQRTVRRQRYICYGKKYKQAPCNGPTGCTAHILDGVIKKLMMIVSCLIKRVEVYRDYKPHVEFNIDFHQFSLGHILEIAA